MQIEGRGSREAEFDRNTGNLARARAQRVALRIGGEVRLPEQYDVAEILGRTPIGRAIAALAADRPTALTDEENQGIVALLNEILDVPRQTVP